MSVSVILQEKPVLLEDQKSAVRKFIAVLKRLDFLTPLFFKAILRAASMVQMSRRGISRELFGIALGLFLSSLLEKNGNESCNNSDSDDSGCRWEKQMILIGY